MEEDKASNKQVSSSIRHVRETWDPLRSEGYAEHPPVLSMRASICAGVSYTLFRDSTLVFIQIFWSF